MRIQRWSITTALIHRDISTHNQNQSLSITMAPEIPQDFTGTWITSKEQGEPGLRQSAEFNRTVPTHNGTASNLIWETINFDMITHVSALWLENAPLGGVATGCNTTCKATIRAPALFPASCTSTQLPVTPKSNFNITLVDEGIIALPLDTEYFFISSTLLLDHRESLEIVTGYSTIEYGCTGVLNYTKCDFMPGIGDYELVIKDDHIDMDSVGSPSFVAFANNTAANMTFSSTSGGHISTLAGIAGMLDDKWSTDFAYITDPSSGNVSEIVLGGVATQEFVASGHTKCHSFLDPRDAVVASINKLMLYTGAYAARQSKDFLDEHLDDGLSVHSTTLGRILGNHDVYHTNYWYFMVRNGILRGQPLTQYFHLRESSIHTDQCTLCFLGRGFG